jgi:hypothetical protein
MLQAELLPNLQCTLPAISGNFEALEARIKGITEQYTGLLVQENDVPAIKNEMAGLNKMADRLADARKRVVSNISVPIREFEDKVKGLETMIKNARAFLDEQVQAHIQRERDGRRASVKFIIDHQKHEFGCQNLDIPIQESWLNKTTRDKAITAEVQAIILDYKREQENAARLEQAKADRLLAIENHNAAMAQGKGFALPISTFARLQDLEYSFVHVMEQIARAYEQEAKRRTPAPPISTEQPDPVLADLGIPADTPVPATGNTIVARKAMTITATYNTENSSAIQALYQQIKALCMTCSVQIQEI